MHYTRLTSNELKVPHFLHILFKGFFCEGGALKEQAFHSLGLGEKYHILIEAKTSVKAKSNVREGKGIGNVTKKS